MFKINRKIMSNISNIALGNAASTNRGVGKFVNGTQKIKGDYIVFQDGIKHIIMEVL